MAVTELKLQKKALPLKYKDFLGGFDSLLGLPAFFGDAMRFGMIERLLSLRMVEELPVSPNCDKTAGPR